MALVLQRSSNKSNPAAYVTWRQDVVAASVKGWKRGVVGEGQTRPSGRRRRKESEALNNPLDVAHHTQSLSARENPMGTYVVA